jgi:predicted permease
LSCSLSFVVGRLARLGRPTLSALMLTAAFPNLGNYGLPVVVLAFGQAGLAIGTLVLAVQSVYALTLAVIIASSGHGSIRSSVGQVVRQPVIYAVVAAIVLNLAHVTMPAFIMSALTLPAQASIPVMLLVLGMNFAGTTRIEQPALVGIAVFTRLVIGPAIGWLIVEALGVGGVARGVLLVGSAMPTGVFTILTATQYNARPRFVADVVVAGTLPSIVTVTAVVAVATGRLEFP